MWEHLSRPSSLMLWCTLRKSFLSGITGKGQHSNMGRNLRLPAGRPAEILPSSFDADKLHNWICDFCAAAVWKLRLIHVYWGFQSNIMAFVSIRTAGTCSEGSFWLYFCMLVCVFLIQSRDQCLSQFANLMFANPFLGLGIPHSLLGYSFHVQRWVILFLWDY